MQHSKVIFAVMVATCLFQVRGSPAGGNGMEKSAMCYGNPEVKGDIIKGKLLIKVNDWDKYNIHNNGWEQFKIQEDGTVTGLGPDTYMIGTLKEALAPNTINSLSTALGLGTSTQGAEETNMLNVFTQLLLGQSQNPPNGIINYETAILLLNGFANTTPETVAALKTISYVMMRLKGKNNEIIKMDKHESKNVIDSAIYVFYGTNSIDLDSQMAWINLAPFICEVTQGNADAAKKVVNFLATQSGSFRRLNKSGLQLMLLERAIEKTVQLTNKTKQL